MSCACNTIVDPGVATSDLGTEAAKKAIANAGLTPDDIGVIIVGTVTPDMFFPSTACLIQHKIGARKAWGFDLSAACSAFTYALTTASQLVAADFRLDPSPYGDEAKRGPWVARIAALTTLAEAATQVTGERPPLVAATAGLDARFAGAFGIPAACIGARGGGMHGTDEYVEVESVIEATKILAATIVSWCGVA